MPVNVVIGGQTVILDQRLWSFDSTITPFAPNAFMGSDLCDPMTVWKTQRSVRMVVGFLARNIAQVSLHAFTKEADGDRERVPSSRALPKLLAQPSKVTTAYSQMYTLVTDVCLYDRYASMIIGDGPTLELVRLPPEQWHFERDGLHRPVRIIHIDEHRREHKLELDNLLWIDGYPTPDNTNPIEALMDLLKEERESGRYRRQLWERGGRFPGWIERPLESPDWSTTARTNWKDSFKGFDSEGTRAGQTPMFEEGMKYHELANGITPESAQQLETRKFSIAEVAAAFFLPPVFVGILDNANYSNVSAFREVLYSDTLGPWFQQIQQVYNMCVIPHPRVFGTSGVYVEFNVGEKLRLSFDEQTKIFRTATGAPFMTRNEARQRLNLPNIADADQLVLPLNVGLGDDGASPSGEPNPQQDGAIDA